MTERRIMNFPLPLHRKRCGRVGSSRDTSGEGSEVVKGTNRRVVVVRSPDERIFEQAIFIVREDYLQSEREGTKRLMEEARRAAGEYMARLKTPRRRRRLRPFFIAAGVAVAALAFFAVRFGGVLF